MLKERIRTCQPEDFEDLALDVFAFQAAFNPVYCRFLNLLHVDPAEVKGLEEIPFLPISVFKLYLLKTQEWIPQMVFQSSGTTGTEPSRHAVRDTEWYLEQSKRGFAQYYGQPSDYCFFALLPSYLERANSSLVWMAEDFIRASRYRQSGFFLHDHEKLRDLLRGNKAAKVPTVLIGVSFALLDLIEEGPVSFPELIVMETGGMKGRREEITREDLHGRLKAGFGVRVIHSEYGMTELLSQAYSKGEGVFFASPAMRIVLRDLYDPFALPRPGQTGAINVIDLANLDTISFIATDDLGRDFPGGGFQVLGRLDYSDLRGCNLMVREVH
ncbi:MAG: acyl transferase [Haliscomenobacter sp.]|nr:acyl transferase [Haliscomenobacter sp.]MBK8877766.1 acyl transferase [Haliscomenobacter sp.]